LDVRYQMATKLAELNQRLDRLEKENNQEVLTLVEILSNATFFGEMKKTSCEYAVNGQCGFFTLKAEAKNRIPVVTECRIKTCEEPSFHCHIELSNLTCTLCQNQTAANDVLLERLENRRNTKFNSNLIENKSAREKKSQGLKK